MMSTFRRLLTISASSAVALVLATGTANASFIQTATGGTIAGFNSSPNSTFPPATAPGSTTVSGWNQTAANASIPGLCPAGFLCSGPAVLTGIEVGVTAGLTGSVNLLGGVGNVAGNAASSPPGVYSGGSATATSGVAADLALELDTYDPLGTDIATFDPQVVTVNTNGIAGGHNFYTVTATGTTGTGNLFTGASTGTQPLTLFYQSSDANWTTEMADYSVANVALSLYLNNNAAIGSSSAQILNSSQFAGAVGSGLVTVDYLYTFTETQIAPEPTTLFLMGSALVGVGLLRKRIKS